MPQPRISIQPSPLQSAAALAVAVEALDVHLGGRLGEGEVVRAEAHDRVLAVQPLGKHLQRALQVGHA